MRMLRFVSLSIALGIAAVPTAAPAQQTPAERVALALAGEMLTSARALEAGARYDATRPLDRALHLAEFAEHSAEVGGETFRDALQAVKSARHDLQMGRPEQAAVHLTAAAARLEDMPGGVRLSGIDPDRLGDVEGLPVLDLRGHELGEIVEFTEGEEGLFAGVEHGDFIFFGGEITPVEADRLLVGGGFALWPEDVPPGAFEN